MFDLSDGKIVKLSEKAYIERLFDLNTEIVIVPEHSGFMTYPRKWESKQKNHCCHLLYLILEGHGQVHYRQKSYQLNPGGLFWFPPGIERTIVMAKNSRKCYLNFQLRYKNQNMAPRKPLFVLPNAWSLEALLKKIVISHFSQGLYRSLVIRAEMAALLLQIIKESKNHGDEPQFSSQTQSKIFELSEKNMHKRLSPPIIARFLDLSPDYFARKFKKTYGMSCRSWLLQRRMQKAGQILLETLNTISQVADRLGYTDIYLFSRQFKKVTGVSPREFRRKHTNAKN